MKQPKNILTDLHGRKHKYLRISLTDRCNLRCTYCMPENGISLSPKAEIATADELFQIAKTFVENGVTKIRLTGGEPLIRKDAETVLRKLASLPVELAITTNGVIVDKFIPLFKELGINTLNVSLDTLIPEKFASITRRDYFKRVTKNIDLLLENDFHVKINVVLIKDFNEDEILDFIKLSKDKLLHVRFIEFMPFDGNKWSMDKMVSYATILENTTTHFGKEKVQRINDRENDTAKNYRIENYKGTFAVISSVTNPFCDSCDRVRLTANGKIKNCLFSSTEQDLLTPLRTGKDITPIIEKAILGKEKIRGGMDTLKKLQEPNLHQNNRSMVAIGG